MTQLLHYMLVQIPQVPTLVGILHHPQINVYSPQVPGTATILDPIHTNKLGKKHQQEQWQRQQWQQQGYQWQEKWKQP
jgi:hypothetical protein